MKREKALIIYRAYRLYKFKAHLKKRHAARKILRWLQHLHHHNSTVLIQSHIRSYLAHKKLETLKKSTKTT
jgi:predicted nicotinamide N-methyase